MSGSASVTNTFQARSGSIPLANLDTNFTDITGYLNDPTNRNNYATDTGTTDTILISFTPPVTGYTAGLSISWKSINGNSGGAMVVNANSVGAKALLNPDQSVPQAGQFIVGGVYDAVYDGTQFILQTGYAVPATKAQVQTATSAITFVSPAQAQNHPGVSKAWASFNGSATGTTTISGNGYNISTITRTGTGSYTVVFATPFANTLYGGIVCGNQGVNGLSGGLSPSRGTGTCFFTVTSGSNNAAADAALVMFMVYGTQ